MPENIESFSLEKPEEENLELKKEREGKARKYILGQVFDSHKNGSERIEEIISSLRPFLESEFINGKSIEKSLKECVDIKGRDEFINKVFSILEPIYEFGDSHPEDMQRTEGEEFERIAINEVFTCDIDRNVVNIHLPSSGVESFKIKNYI